MKIPQHRLPGLVGLLVAARVAHGAIVTVSDGDFDPADWEVVVSSFTSTGAPIAGGDVITSQEPGGNPGAMRQVGNLIAAAPNASEYSTTLGAHIHTGATYDPATQGAIATIDYAEDARTIDNVQLTGLALRQGGQTFVFRGEVFTSPAWTRIHREGLVPANFELVTPGGLTGGARPDFSASGAPIQLGFLRANSNGLGGGTYVATAAIDNWVVRLNPPCTTVDDCDDGDLCTTDACTGGACAVQQIDCSDDDPCTVDGCAGGVCQHPLLVCNDEDPCTTDTCGTNGCESIPVVCDDAKACTVDSCTNGSCLHVAFATETLVEERLGALIAIVKGRACAGDTLLKQVAKKLTKKLAKAKAKVARADGAARAELVAKLLAKADDLLDAARTILDKAATTGLVSPPCAAELSAFLDEIGECVDGVPR